MVQFVVRDVAPGVRLHVSPDARWKTTTIDVRIAAPLAEDPTRTALVNMILERGTESLPSQRAISVRLEEMYDADLVTDVIRSGDAQVVEVKLEVAGRRYTPRGGPDPLAEGLALLAELLQRPALDRKGRFREADVRVEKENLRHHIQGLRDERGEYAYERTVRLLGRGEPSERYELGAVEDLRAIGPADLTERWRALIARYPLDILVAGDHDPDALEREVRAAFRFEERRSGPAVALPATRRAPREGPPARAVERVDVQQAHLCLGYRTGTGYLDPDYAALFVMNAVLGADAQSRLFLNVREDAGLAYEAGTAYDRHKGTITAHCGIAPGNAARVEALVEAEVARLRDEDVPEDELEEARKFAIERAAEIEDDPGLRIAFAYGRTLGGRGSVEVRDLVASLRAVRAIDVREAARKLKLDAVFLLTGEDAPGR